MELSIDTVSGKKIIIINSVDCINCYSDKQNRGNLIASFVRKHSFRFVGTTLQYRNQPCIPENTKISGTKIVSYTKSISGFNMSIKYYNKTLPNFAASHFVEYVGYPNQHFKKTLAHQKVQEKGNTILKSYSWF